MAYHPIITHDIDRYFKWKRDRSYLGEIQRIIQGKSSWSIKESTSSFFARSKKDPFSNLIEIAEMDLETGLDSIFFIMTTKKNHPKNINDYSLLDIKEELQTIKSMGAEIGLHPGIFTYKDLVEMRFQKAILEDCIGEEVTKSRQHYLNYEMPTTFNILEKLGIRNDSSIYPTDHYDTYEMTDDDGNSIGITQTPLVFMDTHHMMNSDEEILRTLEESLKPAKENDGEVMILWHNNNISNTREKGLYREALEVIKNK